MIHPRHVCPACGKNVALAGGWPDQYLSRHAVPGMKITCPGAGQYIDSDPEGTVTRANAPAGRVATVTTTPSQPVGAAPGGPNH